MKVIVDVSVATIEAEIAHQGTWRPPRKYWAVVFCRPATKTPAATTAARYPKTIAMSRRRKPGKSYQHPRRRSALRFVRFRFAPERRQAGEAAEPHRLDRARGNDHHRSLFLDRLIEHVHRAQVQRDRPVLVLLPRLDETRCDLRLRRSEDDSGLALAFRLRLPAHRVFEIRGNLHVADLDGVHGDSPRIRLLVEDC